MLLEINIQSDMDRVMRSVDDYFNKDIPFTVARAINDTAFDVRRRIVGSTYPNAFNVRNPRMANVLWNVKKVTNLSAFKRGEVSAMEGGVFQNHNLKGGGRDWVDNHLDGGIKRPHSGSSIAIPKDGESMRSGNGRISARNKPMRITDKKDTFLMKDKAGRKKFIARRNGKNLDVVYVFAKSARIEGKFQFYQDAFDTVDQVMLGHWTNRMNEVVAKSRFTTG